MSTSPASKITCLYSRTSGMFVRYIRSGWYLIDFLQELKQKKESLLQTIEQKKTVISKNKHYVSSIKGKQVQ